MLKCTSTISRKCYLPPPSSTPHSSFLIHKKTMQEEQHSPSLLYDSVDEFTETQCPPNLYTPLATLPTNHPSFAGVAAVSVPPNRPPLTNSFAKHPPNHPSNAVPFGPRAPALAAINNAAGNEEEDSNEALEDCDDEIEEKQQFLNLDGKTIPAPTEFADIEIVGLHSATSGRSCSIHQCCGTSVVPGDVLRLVSTIVFLDGGTEQGIKLVKIEGGHETCTVGFVPRVWVNLAKVKRNVGHFGQIKELYRDSLSSFKREKSHRNMGMASMFFLNEVQKSE